ncbi:MAG: outer membrane beta-barrel protein [Bacteroidota bacterium]
MILRAFVVGLCLLISGQVMSQISVGIRAGLNQATFSGPTDSSFNEEHGLNGGFHFGINVQYNLTDRVGFRSEIAYTQIGSSYNMFSPEGYYVFPLPEEPRLVISDTSDNQMKFSNAYLQLPQTVHFSISEKLELFGGGYLGFLINPLATGTITFGGARSQADHRFRQGLNFNYFSDGDVNPFIGGTNELIRIIVANQDVDLLRTVNSQEFLDNGVTQSRFLSIDYGLIGGFAYYLNKGLYAMGRVEYGMRDITRNVADYSLTEVNDDGSLIFVNDQDRNVVFSLSLGFRF